MIGKSSVSIQSHPEWTKESQPRYFTNFLPLLSEELTHSDSLKTRTEKL